MIYVTGDTHGEIDIGKLSNKNFPDGKNLTENDYLIILGDFGFPFYDKEIMKTYGKTGEYAYWTRWLAMKPYTILFIDGNHDNFNFWDAQPIIRKWGGNVQRHPDIPNTYHLMRGEIYEIDNNTIFTFGGAVSIDIMHRTKNISWWPQEQATDEQIEHARKNLAKHDNTVDYIFTHTMPQKLIKEYGCFTPISDKGAEFFDEILENVDYKLWCCGHFHIDDIDEKHKLRMFYNDIKQLHSITEMRKT